MNTLEYRPLKLPTPAHWHIFFHPEAQGDSPRYSLHPWQIWASDLISEEYTRKDPLLLGLQTCNSSGKDRFVIAPTAPQLAASRIKHRVIVTSSSGRQLAFQTEAAVREECEIANRTLGAEFFKLNQRHITCSETGSEIIFFATDSAGTTEGYHPSYEDEMTIIENESKSIEDDLYRNGLLRCEGYSRWIAVSSPGEELGHFYDRASNAVYYPADRIPGRWYFRHISDEDCPHISKTHIERLALELGSNSSTFLSSVKGLFTAAGEDKIITWDNLRECAKKCEIVGRKLFGAIRAGVDLAVGRDEIVVSVWHGNVQLALESFREDDAIKIADQLVLIFKKYRLLPENIFADDGGVGHAILDILRNKGWEVNRVLNQHSPLTYKHLYANRGAELYNKLARCIQEGVLWIMPDTTLQKQLTTRSYKRQEGKLKLVPKPELRNRGIRSPDRADATVLAFAGIYLEEFFAQCGVKFSGEQKPVRESVEKVIEPITGREAFYYDKPSMRSIANKALPSLRNMLSPRSDEGGFRPFEFAIRNNARPGVFGARALTGILRNSKNLK